jgi:hypothetical protein
VLRTLKHVAAFRYSYFFVIIKADVLTLSLTTPCAPLDPKAFGFGLICPIKIGQICPRAMS